MMLSALALALAATPDMPPATTPALAPIGERVANRSEARIPSTRSIASFRAEREDGTDVLYVETRPRRWYRGEMQCFGMGDVRHALGFAPLDRGFGLERMGRVAFFETGARNRSECRLTTLVELTDDEAVELKLARPRKPTPDANPNAATQTP